MIEFAFPWMFLLLPLPVLVVWLAPEHKEKKHSVQVPYFNRLVQVTGEAPKQGAVLISRNNIQRILISIAWICLVTSMAKPELIGPPNSQEKSARDLMIAVDLSGSMQIEDFTDSQGNKVSRLTAVKQVLTSFVESRGKDRLGLILFGDAPYLQAPFTEDTNTWLTLLRESEIGMAGQSTAFGDAIGLAISVFENSETQNRVLIVLTDGNDTGSRVPPVDAAKVAAAYNIKIYSIAIGDPTAAGEEKVDVEVLEDIAKATNGQHYLAIDNQALSDVYQQINDLEPEKFDSISYRPRTSAHHYPIVVFMLIYLVSLTLVNIRFYFKQRKQEA
ncbi:vWA domain-containing protein [Thalassotalea agarivorans]|uniref:Ca-activated chloride channel family protein n=1 Tax=Thalassotalea agarivorans TaxID=349064 RepID=A0A1I0EUD3_THASX|nr:VWA domain-containing protein [Thalassotalea agarivorans]SET48203.1 Ca-activated chloride channel family protein [Thalassotalea agarivorans]